MSLLSKIVSISIDTITSPLDIIEDVSDTLNGYTPRNTTNKIKKIARKTSEAVEDIIDLDLI